MLPDGYIRKSKRDLAESDTPVESKTLHEPDPDFYPSPDEDAPSST
jgi:hypothetical protein